MSEQDESKRRGKRNYARLELYWPNDTMLQELRQEADLRGVTIQQHIRDLLMARHLQRRGQDYQALLWVPSTGSSPPPVTPNPESEVTEEDEATAAARALKASLLSQLDDDEE